MDKIISNGTEVLIFSESKNNDSKILKKKKSIKGVIISSKKSEDLSYHGSPWYEQIYTVLGYNGKTYEATYGSENSLIGNVYILTVDHYIKYINHLIEENNKKMIDLQTENESLREMLTYFTNYKELIENKASNYLPSNDSKVISELMESFKCNPDKKAEILAKYETLTKGKIRSKSLTPKKKQ